MLQQALSGLQHLHSNRIVHRDFRADNLLVASVVPLVVKVTDFGLSHQVGARTCVSRPLCRVRAVPSS